MSIFNIKKYKLAKILINDIEVILKHIDSVYKLLHHYRMYKPVQRILHTLADEKSVLQAHLNEQKNIKRNKGEEKTNEQ